MKLGLFGLAILAFAFSGTTASAQVIVSPAPVVVPAYGYPGVTFGGSIRPRGGVVIAGAYAPAPVVPAYSVPAYSVPAAPVVPAVTTVVPAPVVVQAPPVVSVGVGVVPVVRPAFYYGRPYVRYYRR